MGHFVVVFMLTGFLLALFDRCAVIAREIRLLTVSWSPCVYDIESTYFVSRTAAIRGPDLQSLLKGLKMNKISLGTHPYLLGFDQLERLAERAAKSTMAIPL
ncbi:hypothetical protein [Paracoccus tegillarcae]|uniref:hypothetical protein n=1 Tax=Paracoccus tegillarcae TaxID=1529068 RepID=UPI0030CDD30A